MNRLKLSSFLDTECLLLAMETAKAIRERVEHERRLIDRLKTATTRFSDAHLERTWAIKSAHEHGLSIRQIAGNTGLSSSRVHQVLNTEEPAGIPRWATELRDTTGKEDYVTAEAKLLRQCAHWLKQLENGEDVFVNLGLDTDPERDCVRFDRTRVVRILERIAGLVVVLVALVTGSLAGSARLEPSFGRPVTSSEPKSSPSILPGCPFAPGRGKKGAS